MILRFATLARYSDLIALIVAMLLLLGLMARTSMDSALPSLVQSAPAVAAMARSA